MSASASGCRQKDKTLILGGKGKMRYFMRTDGSLYSVK